MIFIGKMTAFNNNISVVTRNRMITFQMFEKINEHINEE